MKYTLFVLLFLNISCTSGVKKDTKEEEFLSFLNEVIECYRHKDFKALKSKFISEDEFIVMYKNYNIPKNRALFKYKQNIMKPNKDKFLQLSTKYFFKNSNKDYIILNKEKAIRFSRVINKDSLGINNEYYFKSFSVYMKSKDSMIREYNGRKMLPELALNLKDIIYIPEKGWRLCATPREQMFQSWDRFEK